MKTGYVTDSFSTLGGLAAVAYGDPEYFREVQNQVYSQSPTRFLDTQRPSDITESFWGSKERFLDVVFQGLEELYLEGSDFTDYIDIEFGSDWRHELRESLGFRFFELLDTEESYGLTLSDYVGLAISYTIPGLPNNNSVLAGVINKIKQAPDVGTDAELIFRVVSNNPQTKLSLPPLNSRVDLDNSVDLGLDFRGVEFVNGYLTPQDYWRDIAYPGMEDSTLMPISLKESVIQGYVGYLTSSPLESLYNPVGAESVSAVLPGSIPQDAFTASIIEQFPKELQGDRDVYSISLIGETINGYTSFIPSIMSNGDLFDESQVPRFEEENSDPQLGLTPSARNFTSAF